jgi:hypothetical protein
VFYLLTLPFRIVFGLLIGLVALPFAVLALPFALLLLPFLLLRVLIKTAVLVVVLPIVLLAAGAAVVLAFFAVSFAVLIPLIPIAFVALCVWAIVHLAARPVVSH